MPIPKATFPILIKEFKIKELFNELGWDNTTAKYLSQLIRQTEGGQEDYERRTGIPPKEAGALDSRLQRAGMTKVGTCGNDK